MVAHKQSTWIMFSDAEAEAVCVHVAPPELEHAVSFEVPASSPEPALVLTALVYLGPEALLGSHGFSVMGEIEILGATTIQHLLVGSLDLRVETSDAPAVKIMWVLLLSESAHGQDAVLYPQ